MISDRMKHHPLLSLCVIYTSVLWLNPAALRTALIYLESPCDLGQQICGIRSVAR